MVNGQAAFLSPVVSQRWLEFEDTINSAENENSVIALGRIGLILCKIDADLSFVSSC